MKASTGCTRCGYAYGPDDCNGNCFVPRPAIETRTMEDVTAHFKKLYEKDNAHD